MHISLTISSVKKKLEKIQELWSSCSLGVDDKNVYLQDGRVRMGEGDLEYLGHHSFLMP